MKLWTSLATAGLLLAGLPGCKTNPPQPPPASKNHPTASIMTARDASGACELERVVPPNYPTGRNVNGDVVSWRVQYTGNCSPRFDAVILRGFRRVTNCQADVPLGDCADPLEVPASGAAAVSCTMSTTFPSEDWEYNVCAYRGGRLVSSIDPRLQTRPSDMMIASPAVRSTTAAPAASATPAPKACPLVPVCPPTYP